MSKTYSRVVITGMGAITALGSDINTFWDRLVAGKSGITRITQFDPEGLPCQIAGEVPDFDPQMYFPMKEARRMSRASQLAAAAAKNAIDDSKLELPLTNPERVGVYFGTAVGGVERMASGLDTIRENGYSRLNPFILPSSIPNMPAFHVTRLVGALGPSSTITTACATGTQTIGEAAHIIRYNRADIVVAGGVEGLIQPFALGGFASMRALPTSFNDDPTRASRPFDAKREGFVFSEGAASLVLENLDHALARGAHIYAEIAGYASSSDGFHMAVPEPTGKGAILTITQALKDAGIEPDAIDYINAHGTSTPANDAVETLAIKKVFGDRAASIPISSTKSMIGHAMGASGTIEAIVCALTIEREIIHPTINYEFPDPVCDLDYVPNHARKVKVNTVLSNSFGLGAQNACLIIRRIDAV
ncbi:MAG: beta-ketoacyl-ACP synthase II [Chloroflexi bacterium]|nr:beta-ketoacyl-ACP synthase II [Chloroflexota bacterium]